MKILVKINVLKIIQAHLLTLVDARTKKSGYDDWITFFIIPLLFAMGIFQFQLPLGYNAITIIITSLSIFVGLLFNMVILVFDILKRDATKEIKNSLLKQILANISFTIILSIFIIGLSLLALLKNYPTIKVITDFVIYFFLAFFFLTLTMILKRMYVLFENEMKEMEKKATAETNEKSEKS